MNALVHQTAARLSLRAPQRHALERLAHAVDLMRPTKGGAVDDALRALQAEYPQVQSFERDFPSLCFALATGVGKTRLMGAFITYLYQSRGLRHFLVLAPNLTIYDKLIRDFTPNTPKYVLNGIGEFATHPPEVITGETYDSRFPGQSGLFESVHINIFNISKMNAEVRGDRMPRIKSPREVLGESYFSYLAGLQDLVLIMDESHRYRADAGVRVLNELQPILGLELTATPQVERGSQSVRFQNILYEYELGQAIADGFVKEPAVSTRADFDASEWSADELEKIKLEDGIVLHEHTKAALQVYSDQNDRPRVKPFVLVVAQDTIHAAYIADQIEMDSFFDGRYRGRVLTVHSNQRGEERDENIAKLLAIESPDNPVEIVIHVNMLKEGWDVTNLYTIVPLRAANSRTLVEQSIGRGLRLPFGRRTGVPPVDRLTIVAHDRFQEILDDANKPDSIIRSGVVIGRDIPREAPRPVAVPTFLDTLVTTPPEAATATQQPLLFTTPQEQQVARATVEAIREFEALPRSRDLTRPEVREKLVALVTERVQPVQGALQGVAEPAIDIPALVDRTTALFVERTIDIPRIVVTPTGASTSTYRDFDLDIASVRFQPVEQEILVKHLQSHDQERLAAGSGFLPERRLEDYVVRRLMDFDDVSYDDHSALLYKLAGQLVAHLRSYLKDDDEVLNVLQFYQNQLAALVHAQLVQHHEERAVGYEGKVTRGFTRLAPAHYTLAAGEVPRGFRAPIPPGTDIRTLLFQGFARCVYPIQRFDSTPEWRFATILEDDRDVEKWVKPARGAFQLFYRGDSAYEPDFVVETKTEMLMCEPKAANAMDDPEVRDKARAAVLWCGYATDHATTNGGKPWRYLLIPDTAIEANATIEGLARRFAAGPGA